MAAVLGASMSLAARGYVRRGGDTPQLPYDPDTTPYCTWWVDNAGSSSCQNILSDWLISLDDFRRWNPSITASCGGLESGKSYCVEAWREPAPTTTTTTTAAAAIAAPTTTMTSTTTTAPGNGITTPTPIQPGMIGDCNGFHEVQSGDTCVSIGQSAGISLSQLTSWNPGVGSGCSSLWLSYFVCVSRVGVTATVTTTTTTTGNGISTPTPTLPGMVNNCDAFHLVKSGDGCAAIASSKGITLSQLYAWNPNLGSDCSGLWSEYYICVSIVGVNPTTTTKTTTKTTTTTKGNGVSTPTPIQARMTSSCNKFHKVVSGDQCGTIASKAGITLANFVKWNPGVGGSACSSLWLGYYVCIGVL
ncbi:hypothetical protein BJY01DRAFT_253182 [Aspergillus pseudoustus]|uniref:LysM domain-containing protein n=1 Tax=Aspergillus pseudoustus TaxID=1810923 RepID=A0ABR4J519_9EURO